MMDIMNMPLAYTLLDDGPIL